jgi:hypothetical protein
VYMQCLNYYALRVTCVHLVVALLIVSEVLETSINAVIVRLFERSILCSLGNGG